MRRGEEREKFFNIYENYLYIYLYVKRVFDSIK